jgi:hypothetical protein
MYWKEPLETVKGRERFWNQPSIPFMVAATACFASLYSLLGVFGARVCTGDWHLPISVLLPAFAGALHGLAMSMGQRVQVSRQEVELREDDLSVRGTQDRQIRYDQLRGYSLIQPIIDGVVHRLLMLYPQTGGAFSVGIPETVEDEQIHRYLRGQVPFLTIIDHEALQNPMTSRCN